MKIQYKDKTLDIERGSKIYDIFKDEIENSEYKNSYKIVDKTTGLDNFSCLSGLEEIYLDNDYIYYLPCIKSEYIKVIFQDNKELSLIEALKYNKVSIEDLDRFNIKYYKKSISWKEK